MSTPKDGAYDRVVKLDSLSFLCYLIVIFFLEMRLQVLYLF